MQKSPLLKGTYNKTEYPFLFRKWKTHLEGGLHCRTCAEDIHAQRFLAATNKRNGCFDIIARDNRQNRTEDLLLHGGILSGHIRQNGRADEQVIGVSVTADSAGGG